MPVSEFIADVCAYWMEMANAHDGLQTVIFLEFTVQSTVEGPPRELGRVICRLFGDSVPKTVKV